MVSCQQTGWTYCLTFYSLKFYWSPNKTNSLLSKTKLLQDFCGESAKCSACPPGVSVTSPVCPVKSSFWLLPLPSLQGLTLGSIPGWPGRAQSNLSASFFWVLGLWGGISEIQYHAQVCFLFQKYLSNTTHQDTSSLSELKSCFPVTSLSSAAREFTAEQMWVGVWLARTPPQERTCYSFIIQTLSLIKYFCFALFWGQGLTM